MMFTLSLAMTPPTELLPIAKAAEACGWDAIAVPDSVFFPKAVSGDYPFTDTGERFWDENTPFTDPFIAMPAIAAVTETVHLYTNVHKTVLRQPLLVAKSLGSLAAMFEGRIGIGVGVSWMPEEFEWLNADMRTRGKRLNETIDILRTCLTPGWAEYHGDHYDFDALKMSPIPDQKVPIYVGGHSDAALRRAATRGDGWIGANVGLGDIRNLVGRLHAQLDAAGKDTDGFEIKLTPLVRDTDEAMAEVFEAGVTDIITVPWMYAGFGPQPLAAKIASVERFAEGVIAPLRG